ncbi:uncharacterized protein LOC126758587 isoform X1 [Bactrocera neohumeralis]|uniref:uncharacterized protein LOC126758587 isoform X1 n=2 Tax=Bactrocera neohumeralis TaxID=98809 RepID=UPI002165C119|nr:uncharacterized protein LOC126758587 isoform X1 [Bactrocera neohumeralis]XP_050328869.1 uncharacterized protein LOC126758587 isoform X1 [Bactrocera neohumeralis]
MSWVQSNAPPPTLPQQQSQHPYPQQQKHLIPPVAQQQQPPLNLQQQQQHLATQSHAQANTVAATNAYTNPAPPLASNLASTTSAYMSKPINVNNNIHQSQQHNSMRSQMHANGGTHQQPQQPGHFGIQQQQQQPSAAVNAWQQQPYAPPNKMMQSNAAAANNNWPQQQQQQQQQNANNLYPQPQQQQTTAPHNIWQPPDLPTANNVPTQQQQQQAYPHPTTYDNYFTANQNQGTQQQPPTAQPAAQTAQTSQYQQPPQQVAPDAANYFHYQQQQPTQMPQQPPPQQSAAAELFDNSNANNRSDGWGDWDWNDNGNVVGGEVEQTPAGQQAPPSTQLPIHKPAVQQQAPPLNAFDAQPTNYNAPNVIEESFGAQSNDNWSWNIGDDVNANAHSTGVDNESATITPQVPTTNNRQAAQVPRQVASSVQVPQQKAAEYAVTDADDVRAAAAAAAAANVGKPAALPLSEATNENYNTTAPAHAAPPSAAPPAAVGVGSNIPNSVYVSQAKPVSRPSRQYASPPGVASPTSEPLDNALTPPQAFQNEVATIQSEVMPPTAPPAGVATIGLPLQTPPPALSPPSNLPPPPGATAIAGNPFKRAGAAQHHRGVNIAAPPAAPQQITAAAVANAFAVPPPPADFANPLLNHLEPDNSEILHENQEVLGTALPIPPTSLLLPTIQTITLPGAAAAQAPPPPPPNDERNQYLQTSPLSENPDEELNLEADSLPPPGLSRLVLGQPELLEATQRMVTGTEEPANMHMDERHADGEDTSLEQVPAVPLLNASQRGALGNAANLTANNTPNNNSNTIDITTDRNLYLVPGESNISNEQRVVTGVERSPESNAPAPPPQIASGQREIELDGENLEDQQQEQQHQQQQQLQQPPLLTVNSRDEPPLEGAAASNEPSPPTVDESQDVHHHHHVQHHHHHHHSTKSKELSNASTGNDESDPLPEHQHHHHAARYTGAGSNKSRKHSTGELERKVPDRQQRRDKQRSSADRYESDDLEGSEPYSSDRERERDRRRGYREGSVRSDREREERDYAKDKRRRAGERADKRDERDKLRDKYYTRDNGKPDTLRRSGRYNRQYDDDVEDVSARRKEQSRRSGARHHNDERAGRSDRSERDYDDYNRRPRGAPKRGEKIHDEGRDVRRSNYVDDERREQRRTRRDRGSDYDTIERRHRGAGGDKSMRGERADLREYEEYRKQSSRNARESDLEKERARYDPRHAAMYGYPPGAYGYDPYATYYYEQMARTNPQAYSEWYKKYYGHAAAATASSLSAHAAAGGDHASLNSSSLAAATVDGRESVHSGRSSVQNENDRYTQAYISQANEYHRHLQQRQLHSQQQQQQHMIYSQQHTNMSLNSTTLDDGTGSMYGAAGEALRAARSTSNLSQIGSGISAITGGGVGGVSLTAYYAGVGGVGAAYYARSDYAESRSGHLSLRDAEAIAEPDPQRLTPRKFVNEHSIVSLSAGILVTVKPKYTSHGAISNIVKLQRLGANDATRQLFQTYPGPLVRGLTHKKTIIEFCEEQIRLGPMETTIYAKQLVSNNIEKYRGSYTLMWNLLILLLRQNGMVVGTDIAELLLKNQQQFPYQIEHADAGDSSALSADEADEQQAPATDPAVAEQNNTERDSGNEGETATHTSKQAPKSTTTISNIPVLSDDEITEKFRNYLLYGNVNEALDWATDNNLWGHALFLASKVDRRSHANVMMKFANKLSLNDPLQTLYQLMSGRQPSSVTSVQDEKWGDWRPHLSMILSNTSQKPELDRKSITTLGDSLLNRGDLFAAHFCYLMAQVGFGRYQESATLENTLQQHLPKLVLLGSSHYKYFNDFAANEAIMMTEIYEYACSLNDDKFSLVEFQPYKYLLATRLLDYGYNLRSLMYFEQIALHIQRDPSKYEPSFINKIYEFADRLKYYDPVLERSMDDQQHHAEGGLNSQLPNFEEQKWLQDLRALAVQHKDEYTSPAAPVYGQIADTQSQIDQQFVEINKQFNELNLQYQGLGNVEQSPTYYNPDAMQQQQQQPHNDIAAEHYNQHQQQQTAVAGDYNSQQPSLDSQAPNHSAGVAQDANDATYAYYNQQQQYMQPIDAQQQQQHQQEPHSIPYYDPTQQQQQQHYQGYGAEAVDAQNNAAAYDYWAQQNQQQQQTQHAGYGDEHAKNDDELAIGKTKATTKNVEAYLNNDDMLALKQMPLKAKSQTTTTYKTTLESIRKLQQQKDKPLEITAAAAKLYNSYDGPQTRVAKKPNTNHNNNNNAKQQQHAATLTTSFLSAPPDNARPTISMPKSKMYDSEDEKQQQQKANANDGGNKTSEQKGGKSEAGKETQKSSQQSNQNSGWFGGIWNKLSLKPKNQMILPDDKNPSIVWDPEKKKWVNTDGDEAAEESFKPPPKMSDIMAQAPPAMGASNVPTASQPYPQPQPQQQLQPQPPQQQSSPLLDTQQYAAPTQSPAPAVSPAPVSGYSAHALTGADAAGATKTPSLQSNMFKMQRNRTLKNSYVDVFNPSGAPMKAVENVLAPALPPAAVPQSGFFIPGPAPVAAAGDNNDAGAYQQQQQQQMPQQDVPQFYNPNQFSGGAY